MTEHNEDKPVVAGSGKRGKTPKLTPVEIEPRYQEHLKRIQEAPKTGGQ